MKNTYALKCNYFINRQCTNALIESEFVVDDTSRSEYFCRTCTFRPHDKT
jgi:hypothetical protein